MKVLFAVNNDDISNGILKKYQKNYKEILSYKNVYYFNAILKELQRDKTYDRVVISEDLEPFANNNYDAIDKFLFEKLDSISDEAINSEGNDTDIIFICSDRRSKSDDMLSKLFGIGIYSAIIGQDRSTDEVCRLINKPRTKKEAKLYYKIETDNINYQTEGENSVSETEVQNILAHYKRLGRNEDKYVDSFNNIVTQYNDAQLKIIIRYLPMSVKAVLEERSPKYQQLATPTLDSKNANTAYQNNKDKKSNNKNANSLQIEMLNNESDRNRITKPIIIPAGVNTNQVRRLIRQVPQVPKQQERIEQKVENNEYKNEYKTVGNELDKIIDNTLTEKTEQTVETQPKRGRGRPRKVVPNAEIQEAKPKRGRGRPRKNAPVQEAVEEQEDDELVDLFSIDNEEQPQNEEPVDLFNIDQEENDSVDLFSLDEDNPKDEETSENEPDLFNLSSNTNGSNQNLENDYNNNYSNDTYNNINNETNIARTGYSPVSNNNFSASLTKDKKVVSFVGTTKNGTSFIVNNSAHLLSSMGISTAILDMTKTRNAYYIYTNSEEQLMQTAKNSISKLRSGIADGVKINKNLTVYTSLPGDNTEYNDADNILSTLVKNYSVVLIDCDFDTPMEYFDLSQEIYLVQSMDVLTIQPLTAFLRNMQSKGVLKQEKLKIVINKSVNIKSVPIKTIIGGISKYNDPSMSYMKDLFDRDIVPYCIIPFEVQNYIKYLDAIITCNISLNGYTKPFMDALKQLCNMIYPLINNKHTLQEEIVMMMIFQIK